MRNVGLDMILKSVTALVATLSLLGVSLARYQTRRGSAAGWLVLGCASFVLVAATHVLEALDLLPAAGWGQPRSVGHYTDLAAACLGIACVLAALAVRLTRPRSG